MMIVIVVCYDMTLSRTRVREIDVYRYFISAFIVA
jgi:hypothetical protein